MAASLVTFRGRQPLLQDRKDQERRHALHQTAPQQEEPIRGRSIREFIALDSDQEPFEDLLQQRHYHHPNRLGSSTLKKEVLPRQSQEKEHGEIAEGQHAVHRGPQGFVNEADQKDGPGPGTEVYKKSQKNDDNPAQIEPHERKREMEKRLLENQSGEENACA